MGLCSGLCTAVPQEPVPPEKQDYVGNWLCQDGDRITITADGTFTQRRGDSLAEYNIAFEADGTITLGDPVPFLALNLDVQEPPHLVEGGRMCSRMRGKECVRAGPIPPSHQEWIGRWGVDRDLTLDPYASSGARNRDAHYTERLRIRPDGFARARRDGLTIEGAVWFAARGLQIGLCAAPVLLAASAITDGQTTLEGEVIFNIEPDFDLHDIDYAASHDYDDD